ARLDDPQHTVEPVSWGYRNPFGLRFAPDALIVGGKKLALPLKGGLLLTENGAAGPGARVPRMAGSVRLPGIDPGPLQPDRRARGRLCAVRRRATGAGAAAV